MMVVLYWMSISHPSQVARKILDLKGVEYELVDVVPLNQRIHLRLAGFRGGTVPALKLDRERVQGSRQIARVLDEHWPEPPLFPADPALRARVEEAERWGDEQLQPIPRRLFRYGVARNPELRQWVVRAQRLPIPGLTAQAIRPVSSGTSARSKLTGAERPKRPCARTSQRCRRCSIASTGCWTTAR
jgi:glutathione S-transferase